MPNSKPSLTSDPGEQPNPDSTARQQAEELARKERDLSAAVPDTAGALTERDNVRLLNDIIDGCSPSAIFLKDRDGRFITINAPLEKMLGVSRDELRGKTDYDLFSKEVADLYRAHDTKVMTTGKAMQVEETADLPDGHHFFLANKFPLVAADGRIYGVGAISHDITDRKRAEEAVRQQAEEALRMSGEEFHSLAEAMPQIVWATRPDGWNIYFNQQWVDYTGMTMEESYGHGWNTPFHPDDKQLAWEAWQRATQHNERYSLECRLRRADGVYRWWLIRGVPLLGPNGEILKWFGTCTDIEDLKRAEVALQQARDTLEQRVTERTEQLQQREALLRGITDSSPDPIFLKDRACRMLLANPATLAALQKRAEDVLGKTDEEFYDDPAMGRVMMANDRRVMESGQTEVIEEVVPSPTGPRTFLSAKTPYRDAEGHIIGIIGIARDITERKRAEEALRESEERFRLALRNAPVSVAVQDRDLRYVWAYNQRTARPEEIIGKLDSDIFTPEEAARITACKRRVLEENIELRDQMWLDRPGGRIFLDVYWEPVHDAGGRVIGVGSATVNLTPIKVAEEALARQREELQLILDSVPAFVFYKDRENHFLRVNCAFADSMGRPKEQLEGRSLFDLYPREQAEAFWRDDQEVLSTGQPKANIVEPMQTRTGERWVQTGKVPCRDAQGNLAGVIGFALDITERKRAEDLLRESQAKLKAAFASMTEVIFIADAEGRLIDFNEEFVRYHRFKDREECSRTIADCPRYLDAYFQDGTPAPPEMWAMARALRGEAASGVEYMLHRKDTGETWWGSYNFAPIKDEDGRIVGAIVAGREITDRKRAEEEVRRRTEKLRAANEELTRFNEAMVGRELRMIELKQEVNALCAQLGQPPRYGIPADGQGLKP